MPFSLVFVGPSDGTIVWRTWTRTQTPPAFVNPEFHPESPSQQLFGRPTNLFVDPDPPAGVKLVAKLQTPPAGVTKSYTLDIDDTGTEPSLQVEIKLKWTT